MMIVQPQTLLVGCAALFGVAGCYQRIDMKTEPGEEDAGDLATETDLFPDTEPDFVLKVGKQELDEYVESQRLFFYWYNTETGYFDAEYIPVGELGDRGGPHRDDPRSESYLCVRSDPYIYAWGAGMAVELDIDEEGRRLPVDLTSYRGVGFFGVRNSGGELLDICVWDINSDPDGGRCGEAYNCYEHWCLEVPTVEDWGFYMVLFEDLEKLGDPESGAPDRFDPSAAFVVSVQTKVGVTGDFCVDEIYLVQ